jgi:DNA-binding response OmpR family regulator
MHATAENFDRVHGELLAKIYAGIASQPSFGDITLDTFSRKVFGPEKAERLTIKEYSILWLLVRAQGRFITHDEIAYFLYEETDRDIPLGNCVQVFVSRVRKKLRKVKATVSIETFHSFGYFLVQT